MSGTRPAPGQPVAIDIGRVSISAPTRIEARRIADALPAAIERALGQWVAGEAVAGGRGGQDTAGRTERIAADIVAAIAPRLERGA